MLIFQLLHVLHHLPFFSSTYSITTFFSSCLCSCFYTSSFMSTSPSSYMSSNTTTSISSSSIRLQGLPTGWSSCSSSPRNKGIPPQLQQQQQPHSFPSFAYIPGSAVAVAAAGGEIRRTNIMPERTGIVTRAGHICMICSYVPKTKNKYRELQDHLVRQHFSQQIKDALPARRPYNCPHCHVEGKDWQALMRHYTGKHGVLEAFLRQVIDGGLALPENPKKRNKKNNARKNKLSGSSSSGGNSIVKNDLDLLSMLPKFPCPPSTLFSKRNKRCSTGSVSSPESTNNEEEVVSEEQPQLALIIKRHKANGEEDITLVDLKSYLASNSCLPFPLDPQLLALAAAAAAGGNSNNPGHNNTPGSNNNSNQNSDTVQPDLMLDEESSLHLNLEEDEMGQLTLDDQFTEEEMVPIFVTSNGELVQLPSFMNASNFQLFQQQGEEEEGEGSEDSLERFHLNLEDRGVMEGRVVVEDRGVMEGRVVVEEVRQCKDMSSVPPPAAASTNNEQELAFGMY